jgi:hypothetical protein
VSASYQSRMRKKTDKRGRSTSKFADARMKAQISAPTDGRGFVWLTRAMLESADFRGLSLSAWRVVMRIAIEHLSHGGQENGLLNVTHADFVKYGVRGSSVAAAISEAEKAAIIRVTFRDGRSKCRKLASRYGLAWLPCWQTSANEDGDAAPTLIDRREKWPQEATLTEAQLKRLNRTKAASEAKAKKQNATTVDGGDDATVDGGEDASIATVDGGEKGSINATVNGGAFYILGGGATTKRTLLDDDEIDEDVATRMEAEAKLVRMLGNGDTDAGKLRASRIDPEQLDNWVSRIHAETLTAEHRAEISAAAIASEVSRKERAS